MAINIPNLKLHDGKTIPQLGFGTVFMRGETAADAVKRAIDKGYRHIDMAIRYDNEGAVGEGIRRSNIDRDQLFVTSKLRAQYYDYNDALDMIEESVFRSGLEYLDLFLLHWPNPQQNKYVEAWQALIEAKKRGLVKSIGVSNFMPEHINRLIEETGEKPVINQIELHPYFNQSFMRQWDKDNGILTEAWSPLTRGRTVLYDDVIQEIAQNKNKTPAQIIIRWQLQHGNVVIPKAEDDKHQQENIEVFDFELTDNEMKRIDDQTQEHGRIDNQDPREYQEF